MEGGKRMGKRNLLLFICLVLFFVIIFVMKENRESEIDPETLEMKIVEVETI